MTSHLPKLGDYIEIQLYMGDTFVRGEVLTWNENGDVSIRMCLSTYRSKIPPKSIRTTITPTTPWRKLSKEELVQLRLGGEL